MASRNCEALLSPCRARPLHGQGIAVGRDSKFVVRRASARPATLEWPVRVGVPGPRGFAGQSSYGVIGVPAVEPVSVRPLCFSGDPPKAHSEYGNAEAEFHKGVGLPHRPAWRSPSGGVKWAGRPGPLSPTSKSGYGSSSTSASTMTNESAISSCFSSFHCCGLCHDFYSLA